MSKKSKTDPHADRESRRYESPIASREHIIDVVGDSAPVSFKQLVSALGVKGQSSRHALQKRLSAMLRDRQLVLDRNDRYRLPERAEQFTGFVQAHSDGFGFLLQPGAEDIYLSANEMRQVFHGDEVAVELIGHNRRGQLEGRVAELLNANTKTVVGRLARERHKVFVRPDNPRVTHLIQLIEKPNKSIELGDYVSVEIIDYPDRFHEPTGKIVEHLGAPLSPGLEIDLAIRSFDLPHEWPDAAIKQAGALESEPLEKDKKKRIDLRDLPLVTIDGPDARDFDDAVYCEKRRGGYTLWVAIADVAHYVTLNSALDQEAKTRGTSVYFPGRVVPMLPEAISNGLCSLNPDVDRLCMVCELKISNQGRVTGFEFYEAVMHSKARLTYHEVAEALGLLEAAPRDGLLKRLHSVLPHLKNLYQLYIALRSRRQERGAIDFETVETQIIFDADKKIQEIVPTARNEAHKIIEECMLCANVAAAEFLTSSKLDGLYRNHEGPKSEKLLALKEYLAELKLSLAFKKQPEPADFQALMEAIEERPDRHVIQTMMLRSMSQAVYEAENKGHFGLAYDGYTHFTSPIRRYPDLLVHRAIKSVIHSRKNNEFVRRVKGGGVVAVKDIYPYGEEDMVHFGVHTSMAERRADDATRDVVAWLKCEYLKEHEGDEFSGIVSGVTGFGFFVELEDLYVEGLVHISSLEGDYYDFDPVSHALIGQRTGKVYALGDSVRVQVASVNLDQRKVDLALVGSKQKNKASYTSKRRVRDASRNERLNKGKNSRSKNPKASKNKKGRKRR